MAQVPQKHQQELQRAQLHHPLLSRSLFPRAFLQSAMSRFPAFWEEMENELTELTQEPNNLTVYDDGKNIIVEAALPGLESKEINVTIDKGILRISGEKSEEEEQGKRFYRRAMNSFSYRLTLPNEIDEKTEPQATFKNGILSLSFTKSAATQMKKIPIKNG